MFCYTIGIYLPKSEAISPSNSFIYTEVELAKLIYKGIVPSLHLPLSGGCRDGFLCAFV